jgi:uncharacterized membrane protein YfcA
MALVVSPVSGPGAATGAAALPTLAAGLGQAALGVALALLTLRLLLRRVGMTRPTGPARIEA